ncbi:DEKNAAC102151 [Brettanomyces naardenensis]|uniref:tRNA (guanine(26)-N(2))-dimethyltransferase n=1 Tax=Brettanomyces naardenensis TaxID=13370 RepID=A0A448YJZ7_BRENA|nr:DEKNAAC102151 [Brettanomyces naardenensis]
MTTSPAIDPSKFDKLTEGSATILFPKNKVFYNPVQQYNRDLSCLAIRAFTELYLEENLAKKRKRNKQPEQNNVEAETIVEEDKLKAQPYAKIMEALSASGLRAIRYVKEVPLVDSVVANDLSKDAVASIDMNIEYNGVGKKVKSNQADAIQYMAQHRDEYHVIDLDPYGTAAPFMDSAIQAIKDGGMMLITCTDLGVLAGNGYPEKCFALYGGSNPGGDATHEAALRLVLNMISTTAAKYKKAIEPLLCLSIDFYVRLFIRVHTVPIKVKELASNTMLTYKCSGCYSTADQPLGKISSNKRGNKKFALATGPPVGAQCSFCGYTNHIGGPMYGGSLHNTDFIDRILELESKADKDIYKTLPRVHGMLTMAKNELDTHFYFKPSSVSSVLKIPAPSIDTTTAALGNLGYSASLTHAVPNCIKTDAPWEVIWFIGKKLAEKCQLDISKLRVTTAGYKILTNESIGKDIDLQKLKKEAGKEEMDELEWLFQPNEVSNELKKLRTIKIVRFQENPTKNWGPKSRPN